MAIAATIKRYLSENGVDYEEVTHSRTGRSMHSAAAAHISGEGMAKAIVLRDGEGYVVAVIPATYKLGVGALYNVLGRRMEMAREDELGALFGDCIPGAVPAVAAAYGLKAVWDDSLSNMRDVYFEGGDHATLVRVSGKDFLGLMAGAEHGAFSHHM